MSINNLTSYGNYNTTPRVSSEMNNSSSNSSTASVDTEAAKLSPKEALSTLKQYKGLLDRTDGNWDGGITMEGLQNVFEDNNSPPALKAAIDRVLSDSKFKLALDGADNPAEIINGQGDGHFNSDNIDTLLHRLDTSS